MLQACRLMFNFLSQVALLFLTRMGIPHEAVWKAFLESVPNFGGQGDSWMLLFNIYVHPPPNVVLHESSIFVNYQLPQRAEVEWGQWSVVRALACTLRLPESYWDSRSTHTLLSAC